MAKVYCVKFRFIYDEENPITCETLVEADNFVEAEVVALKAMADTLELCSVSEAYE